MHFIRRSGWEIPASPTTLEATFVDRRAFLAGLGAVGVYVSWPGGARADAPDPSAELYPAQRNLAYVDCDLRRYRVSEGPVGMPVERGATHLVAILEFDSVEAIQQALGSPEGQATTSDLANFADGGVDLMIFDTKEA
jgi:uncharacterized protein (TIGR02118 family)